MGVTATTAPAMSPARSPATRRAAKAATSAAATAANAFGRITAHAEYPKARTKSAGIQNDPGILSSVTVPAGSTAPKKKFDHERLIDRAMEA